MKTIKLGVFGIELNLVGHGGGSISSDLFDHCPHCGEAFCDFYCDESQAEGSDESEEDVGSRLASNYACDGIESMILAHAIAGIEVDSPAYLEGIETAVEAIGNNA